MTTVAEPARRFVNAQSWWIASELVRRHPHLLLLETHPGGGQYDCLTLVDPGRRSAGAIAQINRAGTIQVRRSSTFSPISWAEAFAATGGHDVVRSIEAAAGLPAPTIAPATGPKALTYRVLARVLTSLVDDRREWDAENGYLDTSGMGSGRRAALGRFPSVVESLRDRRVDDIGREPAYRFWLLQRLSLIHI